MKLYKILMSGDGVINIFKAISNKYPCYLKENYIYIATTNSPKEIEKLLKGFFYPHFKITETGMGSVPSEIALWAGKYFLEEENKRRLKEAQREIKETILKQELISRTVEELRLIAKKGEGEKDDNR